MSIGRTGCSPTCLFDSTALKKKNFFAKKNCSLYLKAVYKFKFDAVHVCAHNSKLALQLIELEDPEPIGMGF